ncbi:hypothetical protein EXIGLDRAFT_720094 [Exidia glandulosa HHB12029]|uniref:Uncharacterized protein n=1 Tax=Exidia glandulosa HHB12029 TaxID=1314781 RepID=A0A165GM03_EXIGL|nr:hypothetical protein EXIGLDRAFT_720094 [Exidia glandulosa HHB12029]
MLYRGWPRHSPHTHGVTPMPTSAAAHAHEHKADSVTRRARHSLHTRRTRKRESKTHSCSAAS